MDHLERFNVRVYGLLIHNEHLLVVDELIKAGPITKLPGGGLELGEGLRDALQREFMEEIGQEVQVGELFYVTDFFQQSIFDERDQLLSIYYYMHHHDPKQIPVKEKPHDFDDRLPEPDINLRWLPLAELTADSLHLPVDKVVAKMLAETR